MKINGVPNMVLMEWKNGKLVPISQGPLTTLTIPTVTFGGDGWPDWLGVSPVVIDPSGDKRPEFNTTPGTDINEVYIGRDNDYLYFRMTLHVAIQYLQCILSNSNNIWHNCIHLATGMFLHRVLAQSHRTGMSL